MNPKRPRRPLVRWSATAIAASTACILLRAGLGEPGLRLALRLTAGEAFAFFLLAHVAAPLHALRPSRLTQQLRARRRELGLSFGVAMFVHASLIVALASTHAASFWSRLAPTTLIGGALGLVIAAAMSATSFPRAAAWIGKRGWRALHTGGMHLFWVIFAFSYLGRGGPYPAMVATLVLAAGVRMLAAVKRRTSMRTNP